MNIVTKNGGKKREKKNFPETHRLHKYTTMEKNRLQKVLKHVFYKHTNIRTKKWGEKNTRKNFSSNTRISRAKNNIKKSSGKVRKHVLYKHTNIVIKKWGGWENGKKNFKKHTIRVSKYCWKKIVWRKCENTFFL